MGELRDLWPAGDDLFTRLGRLAAAGSTGQDAPTFPNTPNAIDEALAPWAKAFARGDLDALRRRLDWDGITPALAAAVLADPQAGSGAPDEATLSLVDAACRAARRASRRPGQSRPALPALPALPAETVWAELWRPWLIAAAPSRPADWTAAAWRDAGELLLRRLAAASAPVVADLLAAERRRDALPGVEERLRRRLLASGLVDLYRQAPVLLRRTAGLVRDWQAATADLVARLAADRAALAVALGAGELGAVGGLTALSGDPHHGGRQILRVDFAAGVSAVYKPRSVAMEHGVGELLAWLAREGCADSPEAPRTLARDGYGWQEWVTAESLESGDEVRRWFRRAGGWLCIAHALRAQDLHAENVIATRRGPLIVDCEMFLQPEELRLASAAGGAPEGPGNPEGSGLAGSGQDLARTAGSAGKSSTAAPGITGSCLASGLLTDPLRRPPAWVAVAGGLEAPRRGAVLEARRLGAVAEAANLPRWGGEVLRPEQHGEEIAAGFAAVYRFLTGRRAALLAPGGPVDRLRRCEVRVLFRSSQHYADVLGLLAAPRYLRRGTVPSLLLESLLGLFAGAAERPAVWPLVADERAALERLDVPRFAVAAEDTVLVTANGDRIAGLCAASGFAATLDRLRALDDADLHRQLALVTRALRRTAAEAAGHLPPPAATASAEALRLGGLLRNELVADADDAEGSIAAGKDAAAVRQTVAGAVAIDGGRQTVAEDAAAAVVGPTVDVASAAAAVAGADGVHGDSLSLLDGACGRALFLAALAAAHGDASFGRAARAALAPVLTWRPASSDYDAAAADGATAGDGAADVRLADLARDRGWAAAPVDATGGTRARAAAAGTAADRATVTSAAPLPLGGMTGLGSIVWTLVWCAELLGDESLLDAALPIAARIDATALGAAASCDVHDGVAGALLGLLALHEVRPADDLLRRAVACGDHLVRAMGPEGGESVGGNAGASRGFAAAGGFELAGFAHGAAGIARALAALGAVAPAGGGRFRAAALAALASESRLFDPRRRNWALPWRNPRQPEVEQQLWRMAWCHGAPGVGLARAFVQAGDAAFDFLAGESEVAAVSTATAAAAPVDHLCCGGLGRAATLAAMGDALGRPEWRAAGVSLAAAALAAAHARGTWALGGARVGQPGGEWSLLRGLSGIGYELLALSSPVALPCPLALELPSEVRRRGEIAGRWSSAVAPGSPEAAEPEPRRRYARTSETPEAPVTPEAPGTPETPGNIAAGTVGTVATAGEGERNHERG